MQFRKESPELLSTPVAEVNFSLGWQQLSRQTSFGGGNLDLVDMEPAEIQAEAQTAQEAQPVECAVAEMAAPTPVWQPVAVSNPGLTGNSGLDGTTRKALVGLENSLQCLFGRGFTAMPQLDSSQACVAEVSSLPSYCPKTGAWRLSA